MNVRSAIVAASVTLIVSHVGPPAVDAQQEGGAIEEEIRHVVSDFRAALSSGDSTTVVQLLHPEARIYEGGHAETREQYRSGHLRADMAFLRAVESETLWDQVIPTEGLAIYMSERHTTGEYRGREIDSRSAETIALVRTPQGWRIRHIHWSSR